MASMNSMVLLARMEATYGTDALPSGGSHAVLLSNVDITPLDADEIERTFVRPYFGANASLLASKRTRISGAVELAGAGSAGATPAYGNLLRAAGLALVSSSGKVEFLPVSRDYESATLYHYIEGTRHKGLGVRGDFSLSLGVKSIPALSFDFTGLYVPAAAAPLPGGVSYASYQDPTIVGFSETPVARIDGYDCKLQSLQYRHGNQVAFRELVGQRSVRISGRQPRATMVIEAPDGLDKDFFALTVSRAPVPVLMTHGTVAGKIVEVEMPRGQIKVEGGYRNDDGIAMLSLSVRPLPTTGDDEFVLRIR